MSPILLQIDYALMWKVTAAGISIVFFVLLLLVLIFYAFGAVMKRAGKSDKKRTKKNAEKSNIENVVIKKAEAMPLPAPIIEDGISPQVVAAISAAIAYSEGSANYRVKSIKKQNNRVNGRSAWAMAGISDNTKPF